MAFVSTTQQRATGGPGRSARAPTRSANQQRAIGGPRTPSEVSSPPAPPANLQNYVTLATAQTITGAKTLTAKLTLNGEVQVGGALNHDGTTVGLNGTPPVAQSTGWSVANGAADTALDVTGDTLPQVAAVLGTLLTYLLSRGDLGA